MLKRPMTSIAHAAIALLSWIAINGCAVHVAHTVAIVDVPLDQPANHSGRSKVQMADGSVTVFPRGISVTSREITGAGIRHAIDGSTVPVLSLPLDSITGVQVFVTQVDGGKTMSSTVAKSSANVAWTVLSCTLAACDDGPYDYDRTGTRARDLPYAASPFGAAATITLTDHARPPCRTCARSVSGELITLDDTAVVMLRGQKELVFVPYSGIEGVRVDGLGDVPLSDEGGRRRARLVSRYPGGITPAALQQLQRLYLRESLEL